MVKIMVDVTTETADKEQLVICFSGLTKIYVQMIVSLAYVKIRIGLEAC